MFYVTFSECFLSELCKALHITQLIDHLCFSYLYGTEPRLEHSTEHIVAMYGA